MKEINIVDQIKIIKMDSISKFNITNFSLLLNINKLDIKVNLYTANGNIIRKYLVLNKIFNILFNTKLNVLSIKKEKIKKFKNKKNKKNSLEYIITVGITLRKSLISKNLNYYYSIIHNMIQKNNDKFYYKNRKNYCVLKFNNLDYIIGNNNLISNNNVYDFNYYINFETTKKTEKKLYEKVLFKKL